MSDDAERQPLLNGDARESEEMHKREGLSLVEKLALGTALAFFLLAALAFGLFAGAEAQLSHREPARATHVVTTTVLAQPAPTSPPKKQEEVCLTSECVLMAADVLDGLDPSVDPCDDFYSFANGGWLAKHPVPEDKGLFGIAQWIDERNQVRSSSTNQTKVKVEKRTLHAILDEKPDTTLEEDDKVNLKHLRALYDSCLDEDSLDRIGIQPLIDFIRSFHDTWHGEARAVPPWLPPIVPLPPPDRAKERKTRLTDMVLWFHSRSIPLFFSSYLEGDVGEDPDLQRIWLQQAPLGLPNPAYYRDKETIQVYQEVIRASLDSMCDHLPNKGACAVSSLRNLAKQVVELETSLAEIMVDEADLEEPSLTYNPQSIEELQKLFSGIDWRDYFSGFSPRPSFPDPIIVATPSYFEKLGAILDQTEDDIFGGFALWRAAKLYGKLLGPSSTVRKEVNWLNNYITGVEEGVKESRGDVCLRQVIESAGWLMGRYYIQRAFSEKGKGYAEAIIAAVIEAFKERLPELDWLDPETRRYAEVKASAIKQKIGYPTTPDTRDASALRRYYSLQEPFDGSDFFGNVMRGSTADQRRFWNRVGSQRDRGIWAMTPDEVNAYYNGAANEIAFPAGELQSPYFNPEWPEYLAFGAFGAVGAGHELTHAFDAQGAQYGTDGRLYNWWTNETAERFKERQQCIIDQYAEYYIVDRHGDKIHVNSRFTLGEDVADAGGLAQSFRAWRTRFNQGGHPNFLLPGLNYTREQLFFIAQARGWARNIKPQEAVRRIRTDPHSPTKFRVLGPLSNSKDFAKAFGCPIRENRCEVW